MLQHAPQPLAQPWKRLQRPADETAQVLCRSCGRTWRWSQLRPVYDAARWRWCCPDWECRIEADEALIPCDAGAPPAGLAGQPAQPGQGTRPW